MDKHYAHTKVLIINMCCRMLDSRVDRPAGSFSCREPRLIAL